jgi:hypothetical protein
MNHWVAFMQDYENRQEIIQACFMTEGHHASEASLSLTARERGLFGLFYKPTPPKYKDNQNATMLPSSKREQKNC